MSTGADSPSVIAYLSMLQSVINRIAGNSAGCKAWAVTLVSALLVLILDRANQSAVLVALLPAISLFVLDSYYLSLEREIRSVYDSFVADLLDSKPIDGRLFIVRAQVSPADRVLSILKSMWSVSTLPFYLVLIISVMIVYCCLL